MTAAHAHDDVHQLIEQLTPHQANQVRTHVLRLVGEEPGEQAVATRPAQSPAFVGVVDGPADLAESIEDFVEERVNHSS